jgi:adenylate cyclase
MGLHLGDLIVDGDDLYGDGVNIAARLEAEAPAGGILVSRTVHEAVAGRVKASFDDLGSLALKNIERPVQAFSVRWEPSDWQVPITAEVTVAATTAPLPLPDKPSIAVLPFQNMSSDPEQEYFVDGLVEDIITALSRTKALFVIARNSSFSYKGKSPDVRQVGRQLGVRYVLEGSVRKAGTKVRITGQLVEAQSGAHIWAERFDGDLADIFALQDEIASRAVIAIVPNLERAEIERRSSVPTVNLGAYDCSLRGWACIGQRTREATDEALSYFQRAMELDPNYALAWAHAGNCYVQRKAWRWADNPEREAKEAERLARKALDLDSNDPRVLVLGGFVWEYIAGSPQEALPLFEKATELDPNYFFAWHRRGFACLRLGKPAIPYFERALRLNPRDKGAPFTQNALANAYLHAGDFAKAAELAEDALRHQPGYPPSLLTLIAARAHAAQVHEARAAVKTLLGLRPDASISNMVVDDNFPTYRQMMTEGCRLAGLPE